MTTTFLVFRAAGDIYNNSAFFSSIFLWGCCVEGCFSPAMLWCGPFWLKHSGTRLPPPGPLWPPLPLTSYHLWVTTTLMFPCCPPSVKQAVVNIILFLQAFLGQLIFGEAQISLWWVGTSLTFAGLLVLQWVSPQDGQQNTVAKDE